MPTAEMIAAVSAAVKGDATPVDDAPPDDATPPDTSSAPPPDTNAAPAGDLVGTPPPDTNTAPDTVVDAQGRVRRPDGTFAPATAATPPADGAAPVTPPAGAAATPPVTPPVVPPKALDPVNDPPPPNAKPETRERITTLANMVKERDTTIQTTTAERDQARTDFELLTTPLRNANASHEQFVEVCTLLGDINSPHPQDRMRALQYLQNEAAALAEQLGVVLPGVDPLQGHADLMQQVQANPALRATLEETARLRRLTAANVQHQQGDAQRREQQRLQTQATTQGRAALVEVEQAFKEANAPLYAAKVAKMNADPAFVAQMKAAHPAQWAPMFAKKFRETVVAAPAPTPAPVTPPVPPRTPAPLRGRQPAGSQARPPTTMLEAVRASLQ